MTKLKAEIASLQGALYRIEREVQRVRTNPNNAINDDIYKSWLETIRFATIGLQGTLPILAARDAAEKTLLGLAENLKSRDGGGLSSGVMWCGVHIPVPDARILAMDAYLAVCWALNDRLSNIIGRVIGNKKNRDNQTSHKLVEAFQRQDILGVSGILSNLYGEEIGFSYLLRNCYMHEGGMIDNTPILGGSTGCDAFEVTGPIAEKLNGEIGKRPNATIAKQGNLIAQLQKCHERLDEMFVSLLRLMRGTLIVEIEAFADIDGFQISNEQ